MNSRVHSESVTAGKLLAVAGYDQVSVRRGSAAAQRRTMPPKYGGVAWSPDGSASQN
jgi:hypothetical protein